MSLETLPTKPEVRRMIQYLELIRMENLFSMSNIESKAYSTAVAVLMDVFDRSEVA